MNEKEKDIIFPNDNQMFYKCDSHFYENIAEKYTRESNYYFILINDEYYNFSNQENDFYEVNFIPASAITKSNFLKLCKEMQSLTDKKIIGCVYEDVKLPDLQEKAAAYKVIFGSGVYK